jgi:hypothetical protein
VLRPTKSRNERIGEGIPVVKARLNPVMLDVAFVNNPHSCAQSVCEIITEEFEFREYQTQQRLQTTSMS